MDEFEDRVRRTLQHPSMSADATEVLADVHRGVRNRQQRRLAVGAAGLLAVLTATGVLTGTTTGPDTMNVHRLSKNGRALCTA